MRSLSRLLVIGVVTAALLAPSAVAQEPIPAQVTEAVSGNAATVRTASGVVLGVRLIGIDAPAPGECGAESARARLAELRG